MEYQSSEAVVLRRVRFSESSLVVVLFSREFGTIEALAKGARRWKSPMRGHLDLFNVVEAMWIERPQQSLDLVTETYLFREFFHLRQRPLAYASASLLGELLTATCMIRDPHPAAYDLLIKGLEALEEEEHWDRGVTKSFLFLLRPLGFSPHLEGCIDCGLSRDTLTKAFLSGVRGGLVCPSCFRGRPRPALSHEALDFLCFPESESSLDRATSVRLIFSLGFYMQEILQRPLRSLTVLRSLLRAPRSS